MEPSCEARSRKRAGKKRSAVASMVCHSLRPAPSPQPPHPAAPAVAKKEPPGARSPLARPTPSREHGRVAGLRVRTCDGVPLIQRHVPAASEAHAVNEVGPAAAWAPPPPPPPPPGTSSSTAGMPHCAAARHPACRPLPKLRAQSR
eukprot:scaffold1104_cov299-Prasinococcus_capsulatus_cf.AAC.5